MTIVGFNFTKLVGERNSGAKGKININNRIKILNVEESNVSLGADQKAIKYTFEFGSDYEPNFGKISIVGEILDLRPDAQFKDIMKKWTKDKKLDKEITEEILNTALNRSNIQALIMARDLNLPAPIPLPRIEKNAK